MGHRIKIHGIYMCTMLMIFKFRHSFKSQENAMSEEQTLPSPKS